jgi:putative PIN family toxin of toxin-antitoxin system
MTPTGVYDTKVIVSAILKPGSIPASLVGLAMEGSVRLILSPAILEEYREVLKRPKFAFDPSTVDVFLHDLEKAAFMVHPTKRVRRALDEPDNRILGCAQAAKAHYSGSRMDHIQNPTCLKKPLASVGERVCRD